MHGLGLTIAENVERDGEPGLVLATMANNSSEPLTVLRRISE